MSILCPWHWCGTSTVSVLQYGCRCINWWTCTYIHLGKITSSRYRRYNTGTCTCTVQVLSSGINTRYEYTGTGTRRKYYRYNNGIFPTYILIYGLRVSVPVRIGYILGYLYRTSTRTWQVPVRTGTVNYRYSSRGICCYYTIHRASIGDPVVCL